MADRPYNAQPPAVLSWALVIATFKRREVLLRCMRLALAQTRPPAEVIVVDASPDWETTRDEARALCAEYPDIRFQYEPALRPSLSVQRNQAVGLASSDVVFMIDDDSLMYPDCAEEIMLVYEADHSARVTGVMAFPVETPPDAEPDATSTPMGESGQAAEKPKQTRLRKLVKSWLQADDTYFLPYEQSQPKHELPEELASMGVGVLDVMVGFAMTFRRSVVAKERFCEALERYSAGEDQDLSYRASRHGPLVLAPRARLCHLEISGGRLSRLTTTALADLNPAAMHVLYSEDVAGMANKWQRIVLRRLLIRFLKDVADKEWKLERTRGTLVSLRRLRSVYARTAEDLVPWYSALQNDIIREDPSSQS